MASASLSSTNSTLEQTNAQLVTLTQKYLGNKEYVLSGTNTGYIGAQVDALAPFANLANRYYPTVATLPQSGDNIKSKAELGGYFTPNYIGASTYLAKDIAPFININQIVPGEIYKYIDPSKFNKGRGLTGKDQDNVITHIENRDWLKASFTDTEFDGQVKGSNTYQKFIPYQSSYETLKTDSNGVITVKDDFEFWKGKEKNIWLNVNKFTEEDWLKYFDIDLRVKNLLITPDKELYSWSTDVFGNQYALYKSIPAAGRTMYNMHNAYGELWVKTADGTIYPAVSALSAIFNKYTNTFNIYTQLSSNTIKNFEVFNDTLVIDLSGYTLYEKINFNYESFTIENADNNFQPLYYNQNVSTLLLSSSSLTGISLNSTASILYGGNWYDNLNKKIISCVLLSAAVVTANAASGLVIPILYENDLNNPAKRTRIFPTSRTDYSYYLYGRGASAYDPDKELLTYIEPPVITYNKDALTYIVSFIGYVGQEFKIVNSITSASVFGKVLVTEANIPIVTGEGVEILIV